MTSQPETTRADIQRPSWDKTGRTDAPWLTFAAFAEACENQWGDEAPPELDAAIADIEDILCEYGVPT